MNEDERKYIKQKETESKLNRKDMAWLNKYIIKLGQYITKPFGLTTISFKYGLLNF